MKLRLLLVSALALAFMVPAALANGPIDGVAGGDETSTRDGDGEKKAEKAQKSKSKKAKKRRKNKKHAMRHLCRPRVGLVVRGELVSVDAKASGVFTVLVDKANRHGKRFVGLEATFKLAKHSKVRMHGKVTLADVEASLAAKTGYRVKVMGRACRSEIVDDNEVPDLYAKHVKVKAPPAQEAGGDEATTDDPGDAKNDEAIGDA